MTSEHKPKILIVDDRPENLYVLRKTLEALTVEVIEAASGFNALQLILKHDFCLAIVDVQMPEMNGYELVELLRGNRKTQSLPVIFVSAIFSDEYHHHKGYEAGAVDFMSKPFNPDILLSKVKVFLELYHQRVKLQELITHLEDEIKQRQQAETALQKANVTLTKLNADKDRFFTTISHELRDPFNTLLDNAYRMATDEEELDQGELQGVAKQIYSSGGTIHSLVQTLMTWSNTQRIYMDYQLEEVDLKNLVDDAIAWWQETADRKNIVLNNTISHEIYVCADKTMLTSVIYNLIANALKFSLSGGWITLSAQPVDSSPGGQRRKLTEFIEISVVDMGVGISKADRAKLFRVDLMHTTPGTAQEKGAGLGLIMCKQMVEHHKGRIWVESSGRGTTVKFTVPSVTSSACG
jgi:signal transduction histidine kinase